MLDLRGLGLAPGSLVLLDSGPIVYLVEGNPGPRPAVAASFLEAADSGALRLAVSAIAWSELLEGPLSAGDEALAARYRRLLADSRRILVVPVDVAVAEEAARLGAGGGRKPLGLADRIHVATAIVIGAEAVLTNDEAWASEPACPRVLLVDELAFDA